MKSIFRFIYRQSIRLKPSQIMALSASAGVFSVLMPVAPYEWLLMLVLSLAFGFNIFAMVLGALTTILIPAIYLLGALAVHGISIGAVRYLGIHMMNLGSTFGNQIVGSTAAGLIFSVLMYPLFRLVFARSISGESDGEIHFVFLDPDGVRSSVGKRAGLLIVLALLLVIGGFAASVVYSPYLPDLGLHKLDRISPLRPFQSGITDGPSVRSLKNHEKKSTKNFQLDYDRHMKPVGPAPSGKRQVFAYYVNWDDASYDSLVHNIAQINWLVPEWYSLTANGTVTESIDAKALAVAKAHSVKVMPLINNNGSGQWDSAAIGSLLKDKRRWTVFVNGLLDKAKVNGYAGFNLDFEQVNQSQQAEFTDFCNYVADRFHQKGLKLTIDLPMDDPAYDYKKLSVKMDYVILMAYDEHYMHGPAGSVASLGWTESMLDQSAVPPAKLILSVGSYGYDWVAGSADPADAVTYSDVMSIASQSNAPIQWDSQTGNPYLDYTDSGDAHRIWFLDGVTAYNQMNAAFSRGASGVALWRLGGEDPSLWKLLEDPDHLTAQANVLKTVVSPDPVNYTGDGEILKIVTTAKDGLRQFRVSTAGMLENEQYIRYGTPYNIERFGKPKGNDKVAVLTFDDGPNPEYTNQILDILKQEKIKADFFVVGENAQTYPDIIERMYREGHEIGNHTFTHPNMATISLRRVSLELNATQRLLQEITGHSTILFRPPFVADAEPTSPEELQPVVRGQQDGYLMIGAAVDPEDWERPATAEVVRRVQERMVYGNIIVMHDAGGDRSHTVEALPIIIQKLRAQGYRFETVGQLLGKTRDQVMPPVASTDQSYVPYARGAFDLAWVFFHTLRVLFMVGIVIAVVRFSIMLVLSLYQRRQYRNQWEHSTAEQDEQVQNYKPFVSVVIAAYNEETVIEKTVRSVLGSDYGEMEILVVNDGSTDKTSEVVRKAFEGNERVRLIEKANGGKSTAVNRGILEAAGEIIVLIDADTVMEKIAISMMVRRFIDPEVAAVSGNIKVGNRKNLLTIWQHIEYVSGFNLERRPSAVLNAITVVPGAIGAWRRQRVIEAGMLKEDTLAEDTDLTLTILRSGWKIVFEENARAYTEAPEDMRSLAKQRFRWSYGTLQCLWKHKTALFDGNHKALGFVALPNILIFQYLFQMISPIIDLYFVLAMFRPDRMIIIQFYLAFMVYDHLMALYAFRVEKEDIRPLAWLWLQRIVYRQLMVYVIIKSVIQAYNGVLVGWNKLQRSGNVGVGE